MITSFYPASAPYTIVGTNAVGGFVIEVDDSGRRFSLDRGQRWIPHTIEDLQHPAKIGDIVSFKSLYMIKEHHFSVAFVSRFRTFKYSKRTVSRQVELLGLPGRWFSIAHFEEYQNVLS